MGGERPWLVLVIRANFHQPQSQGSQEADTVWCAHVGVGPGAPKVLVLVYRPSLTSVEVGVAGELTQQNHQTSACHAAICLEHKLTWGGQGTQESTAFLLRALQIRLARFACFDTSVFLVNLQHLS